jgi:RNA polymerase sigma-70 factor (ECF subfamily)
MASMTQAREASLGELCELVRAELVGALSLYLGDAGVAEELANDALVRLVERWERVRLMENPRGWVITVGFNLARSRFRRLGAERRAHTRLDQGHEVRTTSDPADALAVRAALARLPLRQRQAIVCRYFLDLSITDASVVMQCAPNTVKAHLRVALDALRASDLTLEEGEE